jgi:hypothetical protein
MWSGKNGSIKPNPIKGYFRIEIFNNDFFGSRTR